MSRIHEALQKAEQERMAATTTPELPVQGTKIVMEAASEPSPPTNGKGLQFDDVAAACAKPVWNVSPENGLMFYGKGDVEPGIEEFRTLRSRLYQLREKHPLKTVLVAAAMPGEGKSFVAANLAQIIVRQRGRRALLIDADLRKATLHQTLGAPSSPGLAEYLEGAAKELAIVQKGSIDNLYFIPAGTPSSGAAELLSGSRFHSLVQTLGSVFDWVIIDAPPAVLVSDASMIARACDGVILVVAAGVTPYEAVQKAREEFRATPLLGVVLNRVDQYTVRHSRYYGYHAQKSYRSYGSGLTGQATK